MESQRVDTKLKSFKDMPDTSRKILIKMRAKNQRFGEAITQIKIEDITSPFRYSAIVYTKAWAPERHSLDLKSRLFVNEFLFLQKSGYDLDELILI